MISNPESQPSTPASPHQGIAARAGNAAGVDPRLRSPRDEGSGRYLHGNPFLTARQAPRTPGLADWPASPVREQYPAASDEHIDLELMMLWEAEPERTLWWEANHCAGEAQPVQHGWTEIADLVESLNGDGWPWLCVTSVSGEENGRWFQTVGDRQQMVVEVCFGDGWPVMVYRAGEAEASHVWLPAYCQWWVPWAKRSELHSAAQAFHIGREFLTHGLLPEGYLTRPVRGAGFRK